MHKVRLGELLDYVQPGKYIVDSDNYGDTGIPVLTANQSFILGYTQEDHGVYNATKEEPVIIFDDFMCDFKFVNFPFKVKSSALKILVPKDATIPMKYVWALMKQKVFIQKDHRRHWISETSNIVVTSLNYGAQKSIAQILTLLDGKIELNNKINAELEALARDLYNYWFVQFEFPDDNQRPYKTAGGAMVYDEELKREIPQGWKVKKVVDFVDVITGKEDANFATNDGKYAYFTCGKQILRCDKATYSGKSVLIAGNGTFDVKYFNGNFNAYQRVYILTPKDERFIGIIYKNALDSVSRFTRGSNGSIVKFITKGDVENIEILVPSDFKLLEPFNTILDTIEKNNKENQELSTLRDFLLPMLMNGQISVS